MFRQAIQNSRLKSRRKVRRLRIEALELRDVPTVLGTAYVDLNLNGIQDIEDIGAAGVTVTATDDKGAVETVTTGPDGSYTLQTNADVLRIEFSNLPRNTIAGRVTDTSGPLVRFLDATSDRISVDLALTAPNLVTTQFYYDDALQGANSAETAVSSVPYAGGDVTPTSLATVAQVGSVWGTAYQSSSNNVFTSAFLKRHAGFGPAADGVSTTTGGIYTIDPTGTNPPKLLIDLNSAGTGLGTGADPHPTSSEADGGDWFHDTGSLGLVGKRSLGGLAISADGKTLYTVNLNTRELIEIPLKADGTVDGDRSIRHTPTPQVNPTDSGIANFYSNDMRPFAVTVRGNAVFVGVTYSAETSGVASDLRAFVYAFDPATGLFRTYNQPTGSFPAATKVTPVLSAKLTYSRGTADDPTPDDPNSGDEVAADWKAWTSNFVTALGQDGYPVHPEPWLTSIAFDGSSMVLGIRDRFGDRGGYLTGNATAGDTNEFSVIAIGDILRAAPNGTGWQLESNGSSGGVTTQGANTGAGPGGGEFYYQDVADPTPAEVVSGGLAQVPGFSTIAATGTDPSSSFTGGLYTFFNSGVGVAGTVDSKSTVYESFDLNTFGSANGLGDVAAVPASGTVQVGDRVFADTNSNGIQDANEVGISGVVLKLFANGTQVDSVTSGTAGDYLFDNLQPNTAYEIRIDTPQAALTGRSLAKVNQGTDDLLDSDATLSGTTDTTAFTTGDAGSSNHALDIGFAGAGAAGTTVTLGNLVFKDTNNNGTFDSGETGIDGVAVDLLNAAGTTVVNSTTTAGGGLYSFAGLTPGTYQVRLSASNFTGNGVLVGFTSSSTSSNTPNNNIDNDNNGKANGTLGSGGVIQSAAIDLVLGGEPTTDGDGADGNLTLDFGMVPPAPAPTLTLGNLVFKDVNKNGVFDAGDTGIDSVAVDLLDQAGSSVLKSTTTAGGGLFAFTGLSAGIYHVRLSASDFTGSGALVGFTPSTTTVGNADNDVNNDNNGSLSGALGSGGFVVSGPIALTAGTEPTDDGDDANGNLTLDFGMVAPAAATSLTLGNLVWNDANGNGTFDTLETGIDGVSVQLLNSAGTVVQSTTTAGGGLYTFTGLAAGDYRVRLAATNFQTGAALANFTASSASTSTDPNDNVNNNNDGTVNGALGSGGFIQSGLVSLATGAEPTTDGDGADGNLTVDFAMSPIAANTLTLGDKVFVDTNNNGMLDGVEIGIDGVSVQLLNSVGIVQKTTTTAGGGLYSFSGLAAGDYKVRLSATNFNAGGTLVGYTSSTGTGNAFEGALTPDPDSNVNNDDNGTTTGTLGNGGFIESGLITLALNTEPTNDGDASANTNLALDFGVVPAAVGTLSLGGTAWIDVNNNGLLDGSETGNAGITMQLVNSSGVAIQTTTTTAGGKYSFTGIATGDYKVRIAPSNFTGTGPLVGFMSSTGTNGAGVGGFEGAATPDPDTNVIGDDNGQVSGILGTGGFIETGLVTLAAGGEPTTDGDGADSNQTVDLGVFQKLSIGNTLFNDANNNGILDNSETGIANVSVRLLNPSAGNAVVGTATTNAQGQYLFGDLIAGNYVVELAASNFNAGGPLFNFKSSTGGAGNAFEPAPGNGADKQDHGTTAGTLGSGGTITSATIALNANGPTGENPNTDLGTPDAQANLTVDFGVFQPTPSTASIAGRVFLDFNNNGAFNGPDSGISGVTLTLSGGGLTSPTTLQTDAVGNFTFNNLAAGTYTLTETQPTSPANQNGKSIAGNGGGTATSNTVTGITLTVGKAATGYNFGEIPLVQTGGFVYEDKNGNGKKDSGEPGIPGALVTLTGTDVLGAAISAKTATTDASGAYVFNAILPGTYAITETQPNGYTDGKEQNGTPTATVSNDKFVGINLMSAATSSGFNFGETKSTSIAGFVYGDANNNGTKDTGEAGIAGVTVRLLGTDDLGQAVDKSLTTGNDGGYTFGNLRPGTYRLAEMTQPAGFNDGKETAGTAGGVTTTNERILNIPLTSGTAATGYLFGEQSGPDLTLTQTPASTTINVNGTVTITYTMKNRGTATATAAKAVMNFGGLQFMSASVPAEFDSATKTWTVGDLAAGATKTIQIVLKGTAASTYVPSSQASTTVTELLTTNNKGTSTITVGASIPVPTPTPPAPRGSWWQSRFWFLASSFLRK
ncbi:MAG TPA: SdrD B-like domain-containing protein [Gemmataceae bacterium]|jgi:uncharacterized protein YuzE|nr:SdrD B-like domain-containing protein [Gemmataceae bacterium]